MSPSPLRFLSADRSLDEARVAILGVPLERGVSFRGGPALAPNAIRQASWSLESFSHHTRKDLVDVGVCDLGDLDAERSREEIFGELEDSVRKLVRAGKGVVVLGGDHSISLGCVRGSMAAADGIQVLVLDAHSDLRGEYLGDKLSHACVSRRISELVDRLVIVGVRSFFGPDLDEPFFARPDEIAGRLSPERPLWLSLDLDVLDPSVCPGVTNPEPGGLSYGDLIGIFGELSGFEVVGMDVVELAPPFDPSGISAITAAKLIIEAILRFWG